MSKPKFTGERLIPNTKLLSPMRVENLARFDFFRQRIQGPLVLDLGCGAGEGTAYLTEHTDSLIYGVDLSNDALVFARQEYQNLSINFIQMNAEQLAFKTGCFDAIISVEVIEHIPDPLAYLQEAHRILQRHGLFMLTTPNRLRSSPTPGSLWPEHLREYDPDELTLLLNSIFSNVELWGENIPLYESHPLRILVRKLAPFIKPLLPHWLRIRALPTVQSAIKGDINFNDIHFSQSNIQEMPTLVAICRK
jgi:SAM-dependent methyltransferase